MVNSQSKTIVNSPQQPKLSSLNSLNSISSLSSLNLLTPVDTKPTPKKPAYEPKLHTNDELREILKGHILIDPVYWDHIPHGSKIKYFRKQEADEPKNKRFRFGGYVKSHVCSDGKKRIVWSKSFKLGETVAVSYDDIEELWKEYDYGAKLELMMISNSIRDINSRIEALERIVKK